MSFSRWFITCLLLCATLSAALADEQQLATIRIGMKPKELKGLLGEPNAIIIAQPPLTAPGSVQNPGSAAGGMFTPTVAVEQPNTLVLITGEGDNRTETELSSTTAAAGPGGARGAMGAMGPRGGGASGMGTNNKTAPPSLPFWVYAVRVNRLALDQQQLIYRINKTYSLGITITGQGAEARVSDIVACSFQSQPFTTKGGVKATALKTVPTTKPNFYFASQKRFLSAGTSKNVGIGSTLAQVLKAHGWPMGFLPFKAAQQTVIPLDKLPKINTDMAPAAANSNAAPSVIRHGPPNSQFGPNGGFPGQNPGQNPGGGAAPRQSNGIAVNPDGTISPETLGSLLGTMSEREPPVANFQNGVGAKFSVPFTDSCLLVYPDEHVEFTIIHSVVVRLHIGKGVVKPDTAIPGTG